MNSGRRGRDMRSVEVRIPNRTLSKALVTMREWLDSRGYAPSEFTYDAEQDALRVVVRISFKLEREAAEFSENFGDELLYGAALDHFDAAE